MSGLRVLHIIDHMGAGGAQTQLARMLPLLARNQFHPQVICLRGMTPLAQTLINQGIPVTALDLPRWSLRQYSALVQLMSDIRPTIVHTHLIAAEVLGRIAARQCAVPCVITHDHLGVMYDLATTPGPVMVLRRFVDRWLTRQTDRWIALSEQARSYAIQAHHAQPHQVVTIANGIDPMPYMLAHQQRERMRAALGLATEQLVVICIGRLIASKGQADLLYAVANLRAICPNIALLIVGSGPEQQSLTKRAEHIGIADIVHILGARTDIAELLAAADIFVLPSYSEAFSVAIIEAMAAGLPVVATSVGGAPEQLAGGTCGILVPPGNQQCLAATILQLANDSNQRQMLGQAARERVLQCYTIEQTIHQIEMVYRGAIAQVNTETG
jgi:glycosyltransferase involved in cell wall biosynthesis